MVQDICSGAATQAVNLTANVAGSTFIWTGSSTNGATGFIASGTTTTIPSQTLSNPSTTQESVNYIITPKANGCTGATANYNITIEPQPKVTAINPQTICSGSSTTLVTPTSSVAGTTFSWTAAADAKLSGYFPTGTGNIPVQTILNSGNQQDSVVYTITPTANACSGPTTKFVVRVNPLPQATLPATQTICSGQTTSAVNLTSNVSGATFSWTAAGTAGITGFTASGTGNIPVETLKNSGTSSGNVTYTITTSAAGCTGGIQNYTITVNPSPTASATPLSPAVCSGTLVSIALSSSISGSNFTWTASAGTGVTGANNGSGTSIDQTLNNTGQSVQKVSYYITATANACNGPIDTEVVTIYPVVNLQFSTGAQNICSGQATQVAHITSSTTGAAFSWTSQANGISGVAASGTDSIPSQILNNTTGNALTADYNVSASYAGCAGQTGTYQITVNPQPQVTLPAPQTICSGTATAAVSLTSGIPGTTFAWSASSNTVKGYISTGTGANIPSQILTDTSSGQGNVNYAIVPSLSGCAGSPVNYVVTVNSGLVINAVNPQTICSNATSNEVIPTGNIQNATFSWTASAGPYISGFSSQGTGNIPAQTITNSGSTIDSIVYTISANASGCSGNPIRYVLTVNPIPQATLPGNQAVCSSNPTTIVNLNSNVSGTTFNWTAAAPPYLTGYLASGSGNIPVQTITNTGYVDDSVIYNITPVAYGCAGIQNTILYWCTLRQT